MPKNKKQSNDMDIVKKNAEKIANTINTLAKQGITKTFTQKIDGAKNPKLLKCALDIVVEKTNDIGFLLLSYCDRNVYMCAYVPQGKDDKDFSMKSWFFKLFKHYNTFQYKALEDNIVSAQITPSSQETPFKVVDQLMSESYKYLKENGMVDEESEDENYGGDLEW